MVDPRVVADLARGHPPGVQADDHRVQPVHPPLALGATGRGVNEPARSRGTTGLEGAHLGVDGLGRGPAQGRLPRADVVGSPFS